MDCRIVVRFVICNCLADFTAAAKCAPEKCGDLEVSYPFWINNSHCGRHEFQINCTKNEETEMLAPFFIGRLRGKVQSFKIMDINYTGHLMIDSSIIVAMSCNISSTQSVQFLPPYDGPFTISMINKFVVIGCNTVGTYQSEDFGDARCISSCVSQNDPPYCINGCCEITLLNNLKVFDFTGGGQFFLDGGVQCGFSTILDPTTFRIGDNKTNLFWGEGRKADYGLRLNWGIGQQNCSTATNSADYSCSIYAECIDSPSGKGHVCKCLPGYKGNGYFNGTDCTDINECEALNECVEASNGGVCHNLAGSYNCSCAKGYTGDGFKNGSRCESERSNKTTMFAAIGSVSAFVATSLGACGIVWLLRRRYKKHARDEYFRCNGGFLLERILGEKGKQTEGKSFRIFSENELKNASKNYSDDMNLGSGGSSTVYKGILSNSTAVAIKKFKEIPIGIESEESMNQFINEIVILSGLHHKNVVGLVGCCLQTQSPLLVYEFVDGGTISHQLSSGRLSWQSRLKIAMGSADALAYLHSESDHPIIHRDVKSSNILVDNSLTPKVADFGVSRLLCGNDTHLITNVVGTHGYMDPEYFSTGTLTDKSDVYSFGVFLAELLTGRQPLSPGRSPQEIVLSNVFLSKCQHDCLTDILDPNVKNEENLEQMIAVASLAKDCLCPEGNRRPLMKEVKMKLEEMGGSAILETSISCSNILNYQISRANQSGPMSSLFQLTETSRMHGR